MISARIKAALAAARARGVKLGGARNVTAGEDVRQLDQQAIQERADARAADYTPAIAELQAAGATSLPAIAAGLEARGMPTPTSKGAWQAVQVQRILAHPRRLIGLQPGAPPGALVWRGAPGRRRRARRPELAAETTKTPRGRPTNNVRRH